MPSYPTQQRALKVQSSPTGRGKTLDIDDVINAIYAMCAPSAYIALY